MTPVNEPQKTTSENKNNQLGRTIVEIDDPILTRLLRGGLVLPYDQAAGLVVLLRGKPGTGKSTLALQILDLIKIHENANRHYCTLEQSKKDVQFKLASMLVAQAVTKSRKANYNTNRFTCNYPAFISHIKSKVENPDEPRLEQYLSEISIPLYDEPSAEERENCSQKEYSLAESVNSTWNENHILMRGNQYGEISGTPESPLHPASRHLMLASNILEDILRKPDEPEKTIRAKRPVVVIDGLSLLSVSERELLELKRIVHLMRRTCQIGFLVYEPDEKESTSLDHYADMVIELTRSSIQHPMPYLIHQLSIRKARYQDAALGQHQFKIRSSGFALFPSLHFQVHHYNYMDLELERSSSKKNWKPQGKPDIEKEAPCEEGSIIDLIFSPKPGESVVLLGSRNSFKTQLCLDFLVSGSWGCFKEALDDESKTFEDGLLISLIDNAPDIERGLSCPWKKSRHGGPCSKKCLETEHTLISHARAFCQRPGCITPSEFFHYVKERINILKVKDREESEKEQDKRVVFWDLTQMDYRFPLFKEDKMLLPALMDMFKTDKLKSLFMGAGNADNTRAASAMADHVLFCWRSNHTYTHLSPAIQSNKNTRMRTKPKNEPSLMLYVDRTPAASHHAGKALYCLPIKYDKKQKDDKLMIPRKSEDLKSFLTSPANPKLHPDDIEMIKNITNMQGVA